MLQAGQGPVQSSDWCDTTWCDSLQEQGLRGEGCSQSAFEFKEFALDVEAATVSAECAVGSDDAMAGDDDRNGIAVVGEAHGAKALRTADGAGDVGIGASFAIRDANQ